MSTTPGGADPLEHKSTMKDSADNNEVPINTTNKMNYANTLKPKINSNNCTRVLPIPIVILHGEPI